MSRVDSFSVVLRPGAAQDPQPLKQWLKASSLWSRVDVDGGLVLTPLVGYGVLQVDAGERTPWDPMFDLWTCELAGTDADVRRAFLASIVESRCGGRPTVPAEPSPPELTDARKRMFELAFLATQVFVSAWQADLRPVANWWNHRTSLTQVAEREKLLGVLTSAITALRAVPAETPNASRLGSVALALRLGKVREEVDEVTGQLFGSVVEYFTQAFWHVMTFDAPNYPRYDELALQVSLCLGGHTNYPSRRTTPPGAIQRIDFDLLNTSVANCVDRGYRTTRDEPSKRDHFYAELARLLHLSYDRYESRRLTVPTAFQTPDEKRSDQSRANDNPKVIALTTNFDLELERALALAESASAYYHVAMPVYVDYMPTERMNDKRASLRWIVGAFDTTPGDGAPSNLRSLLRNPVTDDNIGGWRWFHDMGESDIRGPLLMKLSGSPIHALPERLSGMALLAGDSRDDPATRLYHASLLDEIDFIQSVQADLATFVKERVKSKGNTSSEGIGADFGLPRWVFASLPSTYRYWLLCGNRLADWTLRLHLFLQLSRLDRRTEGRFFDVADCVSDERGHLLRWLGVQALVGDCADLTEQFAEIADRL